MFQDDVNKIKGCLKAFKKTTAPELSGLSSAIEILYINPLRRALRKKGILQLPYIMYKQNSEFVPLENLLIQLIRTDSLTEDFINDAAIALVIKKRFLSGQKELIPQELDWAARNLLIGLGDFDSSKEDLYFMFQAVDDKQQEIAREEDMRQTGPQEEGVGQTDSQEEPAEQTNPQIVKNEKGFTFQDSYNEFIRIFMASKKEYASVSHNHTTMNFEIQLKNKLERILGKKAYQAITFASNKNLFSIDYTFVNLLNQRNDDHAEAFMKNAAAVLAIAMQAQSGIDLTPTDMAFVIDHSSPAILSGFNSTDTTTRHNIESVIERSKALRATSVKHTSFFAHPEVDKGTDKTTTRILPEREKSPARALSIDPAVQADLQAQYKDINSFFTGLCNDTANKLVEKKKTKGEILPDLEDRIKKQFGESSDMIHIFQSVRHSGASNSLAEELFHTVEKRISAEKRRDAYKGSVYSQDFTESSIKADEAVTSENAFISNASMTLLLLQQGTIKPSDTFNLFAVDCFSPKSPCELNRYSIDKAGDDLNNAHLNNYLSTIDFFCNKLPDGQKETACAML